MGHVSCVMGEEAALLLIYTLSYLGISRNGRYEPQVFGLLKGPDDQPILAPKAAFGYEWCPFEEYSEDCRIRFKGVFYLPLIAIDKKLWHTKARMKTKRYRVKDYFDYDTMTYSDIEPK